MNSYEFEYGLETVARVNKTKARNLYDAGKMVVIYMIYDNPESPWIHGCTVQKDMRLFEDRAFDAWINEFEYYNARNGRGDYAKFFVKIEDLRR